jgi:hypothetical protein
MVEGMKQKRYQGTSLRMLGVISAIVFVLLFGVILVSMVGWVYDGSVTPVRAMVVSLSSGAAIGLITFIGLLAAIRNEHVELRPQGLLLRGSKEDTLCPWNALTGIEKRSYQGSIGKPFVCYVLKTDTREYGFGRVFLPEEWLPQELRAGNPDRIFVGIERADALARDIEEILSSGIVPHDDSPPSLRTIDAEPVQLRSLKDNSRVPFTDVFYALIASAVGPGAILLCALISLPWDAPPLEHGAVMIFRYSVTALVEGTLPLLVLGAVLPLMCFVVIVISDRSNQIRTRLLAWTILGVAAFGVAGYGAWSVNSDYSRAHEILVTTDGFITNDPKVARASSLPAPSIQHDVRYKETFDTVVYWKDVTALLVYSSFPSEGSLYHKGAPPDDRAIAKARSDKPFRESTGYSLVLTHNNCVFIPSTLDGFSQLVNEIIIRAELTERTNYNK